VLLTGGPVHGAPAAPDRPIDFGRDIRPLLEASCLRCHGPERAKGGFRLDSRTAALKGGEKGVDIRPGDSARSPLIQFVSRAVEEMEMPPEGKGEPLTEAQIKLLIAWIDQGVPWPESPRTNQFELEVNAFAGGTAVSGNRQKYRELAWDHGGAEAGVRDFKAGGALDPDTSWTARGHGWRDDYRLELEIRRQDVGFVRSGWEQYRRYDDGVGGAFPPGGLHVPQTMGGDLGLDVGKAWFDVGLARPDWPRLTLGYEYDYRRGTESITGWSAEGSGAARRNLAPAAKSLDEGTHVIKLDVEAEVGGVAIEERFRGEFFGMNNAYTNTAARGLITQDARESNHYFQGANSVRVESPLRSWLLGSAGYFFSHLDADDSFSDATVASGTLYLATAPGISLSRNSHVLDAALLAGPFNGLTVNAAAQSEWTRQVAAGRGQLNGVAYLLPPTSNLGIQPALLSSEYDQQVTSERLGVRYTRIPFTSLFVDARARQEGVDQWDRDVQGGAGFLENPSSTSRLWEVRTGFSTSPWEPLALNATYTHYESDTDYQTNQVPQPGGGYPGFITSRDWVTDEAEGRLVWRAARWLKTTLTCRFDHTDYEESTRPASDQGASGTLYSPGGALLAGRYDAQAYGLGWVATPWQRLSLNSSFWFQHTRTATASGGIIPAYEGDVYSVMAGGAYQIDARTHFSLTYAFSLADYPPVSAPLSSESPPSLGMRYQRHTVRAMIERRISTRVGAGLQ